MPQRANIRAPYTDPGRILGRSGVYKSIKFGSRDQFLLSSARRCLQLERTFGARGVVSKHHILTVRSRRCLDEPGARGAVSKHHILTVRSRRCLDEPGARGAVSKHHILTVRSRRCLGKPGARGAASKHYIPTVRSRPSGVVSMTTGASTCTTSNGRTSLRIKQPLSRLADISRPYCTYYLCR